MRADVRIDSMLRLAPARAFIVRHPSLSYFSRDYLLEQVAVGADNKELSVASVKRALDEAGRARAAVFFVESPADVARVEPLAADLGIGVEVFNPMDPDIVQQLTAVASKISNSTPNQR